MRSDLIGPPDIDLQGQPVLLTDSEMLDWLIAHCIGTDLGAFIADRKALRGLMDEDHD